MTYDPEADAIYMYLARGNVDRTTEAGPFIYDVDAEGRILGIEILSASKVLRPALAECAASRAARTSARGMKPLRGGIKIACRAVS